MKRAAAAPAESADDIGKRFKEILDRQDAEGEARVAAFFARMPAALAALDAASAERVVFQLRAELLQAESEAPEDSEPDDAVYRDLLLPGSSSLFGLAKALSAAFYWSPPTEYVLQPGGGRLPAGFAWCASEAGTPAQELRTSKAQKAVTLASVWLGALTAVRYCTFGGRVYKVWCVGGVPRAKARGNYQLLPRCVGGTGNTPGHCGFVPLWRHMSPGRAREFLCRKVLPARWGVDKDVFDLNAFLRAGRAGPTALFSADTSDEEVARVINTVAAKPAFLVAADGTVSAVPFCEEFRDVRDGR